MEADGLYLSSTLHAALVHYVPGFLFGLIARLQNLKVAADDFQLGKLRAAHHVAGSL
jgi:hypothetical protein